jgi:hypothetical protein
MVEERCPECGGEFESVWHVSVGTKTQGYTPVLGGPGVVEIGRCNTCNISFERLDAGPWHRQGGE